MSVLKPLVKFDDHIRGSIHSIATLVEFGDYECPYCGMIYPLIRELIKEFDGKLRFIFRNFPLRNIHLLAYEAALAAEAANLQGKFWEMHDLIYENQKQLSTKLFTKLATDINLDISEFISDGRSKSLAEKVKTDIESGRESGITRMPSFFINGQAVLYYEDIYTSLQKAIAYTISCT